MKRSISNIAWDESFDEEMYENLRRMEFHGIEIAPTRVIKENPYDKLEEGREFQQKMENFGLYISSMQSIWYGRNEKIFGSKEERETLLAYTKKAIDFASVMKCKNLVFGCPRNRSVLEGADKSMAVPFFRELGEYALSKGTVVGMEANPVIYNTNYVNTTKEALKLIREVSSEGFRLNLDLGTMIYNEEQIELLKDSADLINHIHISEPNLKPIEVRQLHKQLAAFLQEENYTGFVSIEMGKQPQETVLDVMRYIVEVFA